MNANRLNVGGGFWVRWVIASAIGLLVGFAVFFPLVVIIAEDQSLLIVIPIAAGGGPFSGVRLVLGNGSSYEEATPSPGNGFCSARLAVPWAV